MINSDRVDKPRCQLPEHRGKAIPGVLHSICSDGSELPKDQWLNILAIIHRERRETLELGLKNQMGVSPTEKRSRAFWTEGVIQTQTKKTEVYQ